MHCAQVRKAGRRIEGANGAQRNEGQGAEREGREKKTGVAAKAPLRTARDQCTRQSAPPWRVLVRIVYASSYATSSPISSLSTPFPSCSSTLPSPLLSYTPTYIHILLLHIFIGTAPSLSVLPFAPISHPSQRRIRCPLILSLPSLRL